MPRLFAGRQKKFSDTLEAIHHGAIELREGEEKTLDKLKILLLEEQNRNASYVLEILAEAKPEQIYKFAEHDEICKQVCQSSNEHTEAWRKLLETKYKTISERIVTSEFEVSVYDLYVSEHIWEKYEDARDEYDEEGNKLSKNVYLFWLEEGCKHKYLLALQAACLEAIDNIKNAKSIEETQSYTAKFNENIELMSKTYLTLGNLCAADLCYLLAEYFENEMTHEKKQNPEAAFEYYLKSAKHYFYCKELMKEKNDEDISIQNVFKKALPLKNFKLKELDSKEKEIMILDQLYKIANLSKDKNCLKELFMPGTENLIHLNNNQALKLISENFNRHAKILVAKDLEYRSGNNSEIVKQRKTEKDFTKRRLSLS